MKHSHDVNMTARQISILAGKYLHVADEGDCFNTDVHKKSKQSDN